jgi:hypothetical protein
VRGGASRAVDPSFECCAFCRADVSPSPSLRRSALWPRCRHQPLLRAQREARLVVCRRRRFCRRYVVRRAAGVGVGGLPPTWRAALASAVHHQARRGRLGLVTWYVEWFARVLECAVHQRAVRPRGAPARSHICAQSGVEHAVGGESGLAERRASASVALDGGQSLEAGVRGEMLGLPSSGLATFVRAGGYVLWLSAFPAGFVHVLMFLPVCAEWSRPGGVSCAFCSCGGDGDVPHLALAASGRLQADYARRRELLRRRRARARLRLIQGRRTR